MVTILTPRIIIFDGTLIFYVSVWSYVHSICRWTKLVNRRINTFLYDIRFCAMILSLTQELG